MSPLLAVLLLFSPLFVNAANILYVVPFTSKSHNILLEPIGVELAKRGHNVTVITAYEIKNPPPNLQQVLADNTTIWEATGQGRPNVFTTVDISDESFHDIVLWRGGLASTEISLKSTQVQKFLKNDANKFDVVISELFFQESMYLLAHKYNAPLVLVTTFGNCMRHNILTRNPLQLSTVIHEFLKVDKPKTFWGRLRNFYFTFYDYVWWRYWYMDKQRELARKYIPNVSEPAPDLIDLQKDVSLVLTNGHFSFDTPMANLPNVVEIGGFHVKENENQLPQDLQKIMDEAKNGVIYINFGSNVKSSELPAEKRNAFLNVFRKLKKYTVLWKWEDENLENKPANVIIRKWLPQKEILAHSNVKVFVAHGGLIGMQEAIFQGVPVIGVPIYCDQYNNLLQAQEIGFGKILPYHDINEKTIENSLREVLENKEFKEKSLEVSQRFKDRPMHPLDTAMFWIEYVIRNKGAGFMKNPAIQQSWFEYNMLDIYAFFAGLVFAVLFFVTKLLNVVRSLFSHKKPKQKKQKAT